MAQEILLEKDGEIKKAYVGFSLSIWVLGFVVPLYRKEWRSALVMLILQICTLGLISIYYAFTYNTKKTRMYLKEGYRLYTDTVYTETLLKHYKINECETKGVKDE